MVERFRKAGRMVGKIAYPTLILGDVATTGFMFANGGTEVGPFLINVPFPAFATVRMLFIPTFFLLTKALEMYENKHPRDKWLTDVSIAGLVASVSVADVFNINQIINAYAY